MSLTASLARLQKHAARAYHKLSQHFSGNAMVRDIWASMAQDMEQHAASIRGLRPSFWKELKNEEKTLLAAIQETDSRVEHGVSQAGEGPLHHSFTRSLDFEELLTLRIYSPLIYRLRKEWTSHTLDLYIMVNAHLTRFARLIESISGDPVLIKRCSDLLAQFEKAMQAPLLESAVTPRKHARKTAHVSKTARPVLRKALKARVRVARTPKRSQRLAKGANALAKRAKPLLKNIKLARRRARR